MLSETWALYRRFAPHLIAISFSIYLVVALINALLSWALGSVGAFIGLILSLIGMFLLQAALVKAVQDVRDGRVDLDVRATIAAATPYIGAVALASILASIGITIGFVLIIVPGLILLTFWSLIVPEIVIGGARPLEAFGRSWKTVRGYGWHVFGTYIVVFVIYVVFEIVLSLILVALPYGFRSFIADLIAGALVMPFLAALVTLIYYRLTAAHGQPAEPGGFAPGGGGYGAAPGGYGTPPAGGYGGGYGNQPGPYDNQPGPYGNQPGPYGNEPGSYGGGSGPWGGDAGSGGGSGPYGGDNRGNR